jgi:3'(2'), 5'-bisphosphate nucleotidase
MGVDPCAYLDAVCGIARAAGQRILEVYERAFTIAHKDDRSPLTEADCLAHGVIAESLARLAPGVPLLSEESDEADYAARAAWQRFWLVDPLDGTKEFIHRNGEFTVNIALIENRRAVLGVVYVPVLRTMYFACAGRGAFKQEGDAAARPIRGRRYDGGNKPVVVASRSHPGEHLAAFLASLGPHDTVSLGSSLKFCLVAEGAADVYPRLGPTMEWDTAAAQCVVEAAGGSVTDPARRPLTYNKADLHNPWFIVSGPGGYDWHRHLPAV